MKSKMQSFKRIFLIIVFVSVISESLLAQGDGPRNLLWGPKGVTALIPKWMDLEQNMTPSNILVKNANIKIDVFPITLVHNFNLGGRFAQIMLNAVPGSLGGTLEINPPGITTPEYNNSGFADGFVGFKLGLINAPSLNVMEFAKHQQGFSMMLYTRFWYSGTYSADDPINMGSNRFSMDVGFPMNIQLSKNPKRPTWLESYPAIHYYAANTNPPKVNRVNKLKQMPLFSFENHLSHNFTDKLWAGVTLRYQYGGAVALDNLIDPSSTINMLGTGVTVGYQVLPMFALHTGYGWIIAGENNAKANMFRLVAVISYVNMKKLKAQATPAPAVVAVVDTDGDGIPDNADKCPTVAGVAKYSGCPIPDADGDGIDDELDKCPTIVGIAKYNGCPIPDTDADGINDELDKCPTIAGIAKYDGCPIPDTDGDGINDEEDKCPKVAGIASNFGCPDMTLYYKRTEGKLSAEDKRSLDSVVTFMNNNPDVKIIVQGYTSTLGAEAYNQKLSEQRAANSVKYMVSKGIDASRMKSVGFGEQFPIGDQKTEAGRAASRRTVIQIDKE